MKIINVGTVLPVSRNLMTNICARVLLLLPSLLKASWLSEKQTANIKRLRWFVPRHVDRNCSRSKMYQRIWGGRRGERKLCWGDVRAARWWRFTGNRWVWVTAGKTRSSSSVNRRICFFSVDSHSEELPAIRRRCLRVFTGFLVLYLLILAVIITRCENLWSKHWFLLQWVI